MRAAGQPLQMTVTGTTKRPTSGSTAKKNNGSAPTFVSPASPTFDIMGEAMDNNNGDNTNTNTNTDAAGTSPPTRVDSGRGLRRKTTTDITSAATSPVAPATAGNALNTNGKRVGAGGGNNKSRTNSAGPIRSGSASIRSTGNSNGSNGSGGSRQQQGGGLVNQMVANSNANRGQSLPSLQGNSNGTASNKQRGIVDLTQNFAMTVGGSNGTTGAKPFHPSVSGGGVHHPQSSFGNLAKSGSGNYYVDQHKQRLQSLGGGQSLGINGTATAAASANARSLSPSEGVGGGLTNFNAFDSTSPLSMSLENVKSGTVKYDEPTTPEKRLASTHSGGTRSKPTSQAALGASSSATPPLSFDGGNNINDNTASSNPFFDKTGPLANLIERRKMGGGVTTTTTRRTPSSSNNKAANNNAVSSTNTKLGWALDGDDQPQMAKTTTTHRTQPTAVSNGSFGANANPRPPNEPRGPATGNRRGSLGQAITSPDGVMSPSESSRGLTPTTTGPTTTGSSSNNNTNKAAPLHGISSNPRNGSVSGAIAGTNNAPLSLYQQQQMQHRGNLLTNSNPLSVVNGSGNNGPRYSTTTFGSTTVGYSGGPSNGLMSMGVNGFSVNSHNANRQIGGAIGADGRFYSHVVVDQDPIASAMNYAQQSAPLEMAGTRMGRQSFSSGAAAAPTPYVQQQQQPLMAMNVTSLSVNSPMPNVSFGNMPAALTSPSAPIPASRRRTSVFPEKHHKVTDGRYATVVLIPMTYGEGAQTFFASTALSRQRRHTKGRHDGGGQLPIIYSVKQLQHQRLIHLGLDMPTAFGGKPRYAPTGTYLSSDELMNGGFASAGDAAAATSAIELQAMHQRLALYRAMQQQGQTLTPPQISDMQLLKKKLGANAGASASAGTSPTSSPSKGTSNALSGSSPSAVHARHHAAATIGNYDGAATVSSALLDSILNPLAKNSLMDALIQITDCDDLEADREEESLHATANPLPAEAMLGDTATFCVEEVVSNGSMSISISQPGSPLIAISGPHPPPNLDVRSANDDVANAIAKAKVEVNPLELTVGDQTVNSMSTLRNHDKIQPMGSSRSLNATTTNLDTAATIDSLFQRAVAGKTPRPGETNQTASVGMLNIPSASNNDPASQMATPKVSPGGNASMSTLSLAQRKAANNTQSMAIQMLFNENKSVAEAFKAAEAAAQAQVAANSALPNVLAKGVIKDSAHRELGFARKAQEKRKRVAVLIGISKYEDRRITPKDQCVEDVEAMAAILRNIGFRVTVLSTSAMTVDGERDPDLYPTKANILKAIADATKICKNEECIGLVCAFGGGYIGPITGSSSSLAPAGSSNKASDPAAKAERDASDNAARRMSLAATQAGLSGSTAAVLVPPDVYLGQINAANTISLPDLEIGGSEKGPKNLVYIDTFSVLGLKPCDGKYGGFCQSGGRKSVGSEIVAFYGEQQSLLMAYYMKRGFTGYATRDSRITVNGLNAYLTRKLKKYEVLSIQSTSSTFFIGDLDLARVHELRYCRHEINEIKAEQFAHFAKVHMMVIPTRNQDPSSVEFVRAIQKKFSKNMKPGISAGGPPMVCYSRLYRQRFHFFMRSVLPEKIYLNDSAFIAHESKALLQFKGSLKDQNLGYQLLCHHANLAGCLHITNPVTRREFLSQFDNSETIRKIKRLRKEAEQEKSQQLQAGRVHHLSRGVKLSAQAQLSQLMGRGGAGYLADTFATRFTVDGMAVHQIGIEMMLTFVTSEYIAQKMDKLVRVGALRQDLITSALLIKPIDEKALHVEKIVAKAQAIVRGYQTRKVFGKIIPLVKGEQAARQQLVEQQQRELLSLQRNTFASHCGTLELVELKQRDGWLEEYYDDRSFYWQEYIDSYGRACRKDKIRFLRYAEQQDDLYREWFDFRCGFTAFALSLMTAIYGMLRVQMKHDRSYNVVIHEEDQERRLLMARWQRVVAGF